MDILVNGVHWCVGDYGIHEGWKFRLVHYAGRSELFVLGDNGLAFFPKPSLEHFLSESIHEDRVGQENKESIHKRKE